MSYDISVALHHSFLDHAFTRRLAKQTKAERCLLKVVPVPEIILKLHSFIHLIVGATWNTVMKLKSGVVVAIQFFKEKKTRLSKSTQFRSTK